MSKEDMQRTLCSEFPLLNVQYSALIGGFEFVSVTPYRQLGANIYVTQQDIDLSGYAMQKKTFYPYTSFEQRAATTSARTTATLTEQPAILDITLISSVPLNDTELLAAITFTPGFTAGSGATSSRYDRSVIIHGERKVFTVDSTMSVPGDFNALRIIDSQTFSSLEPTAADKLYGYRILLIKSRNDELNLAFIPASRVLIPGTLSEEPQLEYMMRLKRSYELANQV